MHTEGPSHDINGNNSNNNNSHSDQRHDLNHLNGSPTLTCRLHNRLPITVTYCRPGRPNHAAFYEFIYGCSLYLACVFLPYCPRYLCQSFLWGRAWIGIIGEQLLWLIWLLWRCSLILVERWGWIIEPARGTNSSDNTAPSSVVTKNILVRIRSFLSSYLSSTSTASLWDEFNRKNHEHDKTPSSFPPDTNFLWSFGRSSNGNPAITMIIRDIQILAILAATLAVIRVWFVHMFVPDYLTPRRLEALTRSKSSHLLSSSSYRFGGITGWESTAQRISLEGSESDEKYEKSHGLYNRLLMWTCYHWYRLRPSIRRAKGHEPTARYNDILLIPPSSPSSSLWRTDLFSTPRYATAMFRLLYTSISCLAAYFLFHTAEFWPWQVFGTNTLANTRVCWDLSGTVVTLGWLDEDYDNTNVAMKYFFLTQAAYQLHSLCFHLVSIVLLLLYGGDITGFLGKDCTTLSLDRKRRGRINVNESRNVKSVRYLSIMTSMQSYFRPMMEHIFVLAFLIGAYLFSGLRRLGAVGIFTFELSSVFLQLLQICLYAHENSWWRQPNTVIFVHRFLAIPAFMYCRFFVLPFIIWYSVAFESEDWLNQIEKVLSQGWGQRIYSVMNGLLFFIFVLNLVMFRRLLFHPHLGQILKQRNEGRISSHDCKKI